MVERNAPAITQHPESAFRGDELDRRMCAGYQVPAAEFLLLTGDEKKTKKIVRGRRAVAAGVFIEGLGRAAVTHGLETAHPIFIAAGTGVAMLGGMMQTSIKNRNCAEWRLALDKTVGELGPYASAISEAMTNNGISPEELKSLDALPQAVYGAEYQAPQLEVIKNVGLPASCGAALAVDGNVIPAGLLVAAGAGTVPLGKTIYIEHFLKRASQTRMGRAALHLPFMRKVLQDHMRMTDRMHIFSYIPEWIVAASPWLGSNSALIYSILTGSKGYRDVLIAQREREGAQRTTEIATKLIETLGREPFIATPQRWKDHIDTAGIDIFQEKVPFKNGIVMKDFIAQTPVGKETRLNPLNLEVPENGAAILKAGSGTGKSTTLLGILHFYEHSGSVHLVKAGKITDVHSLSGPKEIAEHIVLVTEGQLNSNDRIVDLFKNYYTETHKDELQAQLNKYKGKRNRMLVELAWSTADNLLEDEIRKLTEKQKGVFPIFPSSMEDDLVKLRKQRNEWVNERIQKRGGNLSKIVAEERTFKTLSDGEKRSMMTLLAKTAAAVKPRIAIFLDEPLAGLDEEQKIRQIEELRELQEGWAPNGEMKEDRPVALIIISHDNIDELQAGLNNCQVINLEK